MKKNNYTIPISSNHLKIKEFEQYRNMKLEVMKMMIMSINKYKRLQSIDIRKSYEIHDLPGELVDALKNVEPPVWTTKLNHLMDSIGE